MMILQKNVLLTLALAVKNLVLGVAVVSWLGLVPSLHTPSLHAATSVEVEPVLHSSLHDGNGATGCDPGITRVNDLTTTNPFERIT
ncbi:hypothetical protein OAS39_00865 [Pirellulales bacterium]|nr:hypothetical protein [Pirellulales bacterium]